MSDSGIRNLFSDLPDASLAECIDILQSGNGLRIERIVSRGQATPPGEWFDQAQAEWVILLRGAADLLFEGDAHALRLGPGDHIFIGPHRRHRVTWTLPDSETVWLAVHMPG